VGVVEGESDAEMNSHKEAQKRQNFCDSCASLWLIPNHTRR
jgi:hypothetical protein